MAILAGANGEHIGQIQLLMNELNKDPDSRRHIASWNVDCIDKMATTLYTFSVLCCR